jgi:hypothetical protein
MIPKTSGLKTSAAQRWGQAGTSTGKAGHARLGLSVARRRPILSQMNGTFILGLMDECAIHRGRDMRIYLMRLTSHATRSSDAGT